MPDGLRVGNIRRSQPPAWSWCVYCGEAPMSTTPGVEILEGPSPELVAQPGTGVPARPPEWLGEWNLDPDLLGLQLE